MYITLIELAYLLSSEILSLYGILSTRTRTQAGSYASESGVTTGSQVLVVVVVVVVVAVLIVEVFLFRVSCCSASGGARSINPTRARERALALIVYST